MIEFRMPSMGADMEAGTLREWLVKPGDSVKRGDIIAVIDTQKGLIDIEVFDNGTIEKLLVQPDQKVPVGTAMALIRAKEEAPGKEAIQPALVLQETPKSIKPIVPAEAPHRVKASPLAKRIAQEKGVDLSTIKGSGEDGAVTKEDVEKFIAAQENHQRQKSEATTETIRQAVAAAMSRSNREIPHYYLDTKLDMSKALAWLAEANKQRSVQQRLLPTVLLIKAVAIALTKVPQLNGYWEDGLQQKEQINIGFVISLRTGGVVIPTLKNANTKSLQDIMHWLNEVIPRARALNLRSSDLMDTTFTITSLGEGTTHAVYGVIYPPQVALAGFGSITEQPWAENGMLGIRPVLKATLAADHRATDALVGTHFFTALDHFLQNPSAYE